MGLREQAALDCQAILEDTSGFAWPFTLTSPLGVASARLGFTTDIGQTIDPETGQAVAGRRASVSVSLRSLTEMPVAVADGGRKPWLVGFTSALGVGAAFKVIEVLPDRALGVVVLILEAYQMAVVSLASSVLGLPRLRLAGSLSLVVGLAGALALPGHRPLLSGALTPVVPLGAALALPEVRLAGSITPAVTLTASLALPEVRLAGTVSPVVGTLTASLALPEVQFSGSLTVDAAPQTAWLRVSDATVTGSGISSLPDVLSVNPATQATDIRRPPRVASGNGVLVAQGVDDWMSWVANAGNNPLVTWGFGAHVKIDSIGTGNMNLLRYGPSTSSDPAATDSHKLGVFTPGQVALTVFTDASGTLSRNAFSAANRLNNSGYVFMTVEFNGNLTGEANRLVMTFDGVVDTLSFANGTGAPGAMPAALQGQPAATPIAVFNRRTDIALNQLIGKAGNNIYIFGRAMPGVTAGLLTPAARAAYANFERPT